MIVKHHNEDAQGNIKEHLENDKYVLTRNNKDIKVLNKESGEITQVESIEAGKALIEWPANE